MSREIDALTSSTLRHLRDRWWNDAFTAFLEETLRPRSGKRILDVGCGTGTGEVSLSRLRVSQMQLYGVDLVLQRLRQAIEATPGRECARQLCGRGRLPAAVPDGGLRFDLLRGGAPAHPGPRVWRSARLPA